MSSSLRSAAIAQRLRRLSERVHFEREIDCRSPDFASTGMHLRDDAIRTSGIAGALIELAYANERSTKSL